MLFISCGAKVEKKYLYINSQLKIDKLLSNSILLDDT